MSDAIRSGGVDADGELTVGEDIVGRDKIVSSTTNLYAGLTIGDMFRLRLVMSYERLWGLLEPLARFGRTESFTAETARALSERFPAWYFQEAGGMYLYFSPQSTAHDAYMTLQGELHRIVAKTKPEAWQKPLAKALRVAQNCAHDLRQAMAKEIREYMQAHRVEPDQSAVNEISRPA